MQTKLESLKESVTNVGWGFSTAILTQLAVFPLYDINIELHHNIQISLWFTVIAVLRSYIIRRWYNHKEKVKRDAELRTLR